MSYCISTQERTAKIAVQDPNLIYFRPGHICYSSKNRESPSSGGGGCENLVTYQPISYTFVSQSVI